jgi:hypothetical protein
LASLHPTVLFSADGWGYGTTTMLLPIARRLAGRARRVFLDGGGRLPLATPAHFDAVVVCDTASAEPSADAARELDRASCLVSVMNTPITWQADRHGVPTVLLEGLGWMWQEPFGGARRGGSNAHLPSPAVIRYFVERFLGVDEKLAAWADRLPPYEVVGPVLDVAGWRWEPAGQVLVNVGGMDSWLMPEHVHDDYLLLVVAGVLGAVQPRVGRERVLFTGGRRAVERIADLLGDARRDCVAASVDHQTFLSALTRSESFITAAGMRALLEGFTLGVPVAFLPAQNVSQELVLELLADAALAPPDVSWRGRGLLPDISGLSQPEGCALINDAVGRASRNGEGDALADRLARDLADLAAAARRRSFVDSLGGDGAIRIANFVTDVLAGAA